MTRDEFLSGLRTSNPALADLSDDAVLYAGQYRPGFDPTWLAPVAAPIAPVAAPAPEQPSLLRRAGDVGAALVGGAAAVGEGVDTLAQLVTRQPEFTPVQSLFELPGRVAAVGVEAAQGRGAEALSEFFAAPEVTGSEFAESLKSAALARSKSDRQRAIANAEPVWGFQQLGEAAAFVRETGTSPSLLIDLIAQTSVQLLPSALAARGASIVGRGLSTRGGNLARFGTFLASEKGTTVAGLVTGALQQGASVAGDSIADLTAGLAAMSDEDALEIPQIGTLVDSGYSLDDAKAAVVMNQATKAGVISTAASLASGAAFGAPLQQALGRWVNRTPVAQAAVPAPSLTERALTAARTGAAEGAQEVIEEVSGVVSGNYFARPVFPDRDVFQGAGVAGAGGLIGGAAMGAGVEAASQFAESAAAGEQAQPQGTTQARPASQQPAPERDAPAFVSFDVEQPTVEQPLFVARVSVTDPRANRQEGLVFTGATQAEAELKRDAAGFRPIENMTPEQQVELANKIRGSRSEEVLVTSSDGVVIGIDGVVIGDPQAGPNNQQFFRVEYTNPVDGQRVTSYVPESNLQRRKITPEDVLDQNTVEAMRNAGLPDEFIAKVSPEAAARIVAQVQRQVVDATARDRIVRETVINYLAAQGDAADAAAQKAAEEKRLAKLATMQRRTARKAEQAEQADLAAMEREALPLSRQETAAVNRMERQREVELTAAVRERARAFRASSRTARGIEQVVRAEEAEAAQNELKTEPLSGGAQVQPEQPLPVGQVTVAAAPSGAVTVEPVLPPSPPVSTTPIASSVIPPPAKTGTETPTPKPGMLDNLNPFPRFAIRDNNATDLDQIDTKGGTAESPVVAMLFTDSSGRLISVPVHRHDNALRVATSSVTDSDALRALTPAQQAALPSKRTITGILGKPSPLEGGKSQAKWDAIFSALETATNKAWNRWGGKEVAVFAEAMGLTYTGGTATVSRANGGVGTEITLAPTGNEAPAAEARDASSSRQAVERSAQKVTFTNPSTGAQGVMTVATIDTLVEEAITSYLETDAGKTRYVSTPQGTTPTERVDALYSFVDAALRYLEGTATGRRKRDVTNAIVAVSEIKLSQSQFLGMAQRAFGKLSSFWVGQGITPLVMGSQASLSVSPPAALDNVSPASQMVLDWFNALDAEAQAETAQRAIAAIADRAADPDESTAVEDESLAFFEAAQDYAETNDREARNAGDVGGQMDDNLRLQLDTIAEAGVEDVGGRTVKRPQRLRAATLAYSVPALESLVVLARSRGLLPANQALPQTQRPLTPGEQDFIDRTKPEPTLEQFNAFIESANAFGINVTLADMEAALGGRASENFVMLLGAHLTNPSTQTFMALAHEVAHVYVNKARPAVRLALHRGIEQLEMRLAGRKDVDPRVGAGSYGQYLKNFDATRSGLSETVTLYRGVKAGRDPFSTTDTVGQGLFMSPDRGVAQTFAGADGTIVEETVSFSNLLDAQNWVDAKSKVGLERSDDMGALLARARERGYDGIALRKTTWGTEFIKLAPAKTANPLTAEQWANEVVVETMAVNGIERDISQGLVAALWRRLKAALLDMQMWFQEQIGGPEAVNEETARAWLQNQVDSIIAGDGNKLSPYLAQFTVRPTIGQRIQMRSAPGTGWRAEFVDPVTGGVNALPIIGVSPGAIDDAFRAVIALSKAHSIRTGRANRKDNLENLPAEIMNREMRSIQEVREVRNAEGKLLAPNGQPTKLSEYQWKLVRTPEFKAWFGDWQNSPETASKVVDENGEPMVVYHGTGADFVQFNTATRGLNRYGQGAYFTENPRLASIYTEDEAWTQRGRETFTVKGGNVMPVFLNLRNPDEIVADPNDPLRRHTPSVGSDGVAVQEQSGMTFVAFRPEQIKSAIGNDGSFSSNDPDIRRTERPATDPLREDAVGAVRLLKENAEAKIAALNELKKPFLAMFNARNAAVPELTEAERAFMRANGETAPTRLPDNAEGYAAFAKEMGNLTDPFAAVEKIIKDTTAILTEELGTPMPADFLNVDITIQGIQQAASSRLPAYGLAVEEVVKETKDSHNAIRDRRADRKIEREQITKQIERLNVQGNKMVRNPLDWTEVQREMVKSLREYINEIKRNTERVADASGAAEGAAATLNAMIDEGERRLITEEALDQVFDNINLDVAQADGSQESFLAVMRDFYGLMISQNIDVAGTNAKAIRAEITSAVAANPDSALRVFTRTSKQGKIQGTALLAAVIDFAKREGQVNDIVRAHAERLRGTEEQRAAITRALSEYQNVLLNATEEKIRELGRQPFSNTYLTRFLNGRKALDDAKAALTKVNFELSVLKKADEMYSLVARRADDALNLHTGWTVQHGAPFVDPQSADEPIDAMFERTQMSMLRAGKDPASSDYALKLVGEGAMTKADLQRIADKIDQWIKANENKPEQRGYKFNTLKLQHSELLNHLHGAKARDFQARWMGSVFSAFANQVASAGTRGGEIAARLLQRADSIKTTYGLEWSARVARKWQVATVALQRAAGMKWESVEHHFFRPMTSVSNANMFKDREAFLQEMDALLSEDPALEGIWNKPAVKRAFAEYVDAYAQKAASMDEMARNVEADAVETDIDIIDPLTGQKTFAKRNRIERGEITDVSETPAELRSWASLAASRTETLKAMFGEDSAERFRKDRAELEPLMNKFLGVGGWNQFMRPLLANINGGVPAPADADGASRTLSNTRARRILETTDNLFDFIEAAYAQRPEGSEQSLGDYTEAVLKHVSKMWASVRSEVVKDNAEHSVQTAQILVLPRYGIDARVMRSWPREWRVGKTGFEADIRAGVEAVANLAAFGPDAVRFRAAIADHERELGERLAKVQESMDALLVGVPANLPKGERIASLKGEDAKVYRRLEKQEREIKEQQGKNWTSILGKVLNRETSWLQSNSWALEVWGTAVTGLVSGLRTALKNPAALLMIPSIGREISPNSALLGAKAAGNLGKVLAMSFIQSTGLRPGTSDRALLALHKTKGVDPSNQKRLLDAFQAPDRGIQGDLQGLALFLRRLRSFYSDARFGFSYGGMVPSLRLFNPFAWMQYVTTTAADLTLIDAYEGIVSKLVAFEDRGGDLKKPYTADDVGFSGSTNELTNWINQYEASGGSIDVAIRQLREIKRKGDTMSIPENIVMTAARVAVDFVSGESSVSGNPTWVTSNPVGRVSFTLVGWSIRQAEKIFSILKNPQGRVDAQSFMRGMTLFGIGLLPPILAYSAFLDWVDEETDRKRNKMPLTLTGSPEQVVNSVLEAVTDIGIVGPGWDMFAGLVNPQQAFSSTGDIFSIDNKVVLVSLLRNLTTAVKNAAEVGPRNWTWAGTGREFLAPFGAAGPMANFELLNRVTGEWATGLPVVGSIMEAETARVMRTDANNNVRTAARMVGLPVKTFTTGSYVPKPWNGHVTNMIYAALRDDRAAFREHYEQARKAAKGNVPLGEEAEQIARTFEGRHVWLQTRDRPSPKEIKDMLAVMPPDGREAVMRASDLLNRYGSTIGARPFVGAKLTARGVAERTTARARGMTVEEFRRSRAGF